MRLARFIPSVMFSDQQHSVKPQQTCVSGRLWSFPSFPSSSFILGYELRCFWISCCNRTKSSGDYTFTLGPMKSVQWLSNVSTINACWMFLPNTSLTRLTKVPFLQYWGVQLTLSTKNVLNTPNTCINVLSGEGRVHLHLVGSTIISCGMSLRWFILLGLDYTEAKYWSASVYTEPSYISCTREMKQKHL